MILHKLSQCDSSNSLSMWFCILIGYRIIMILHELSLNDSSILYSVCMILYLYHDSSWVVSMWFFNYTLCVVLYSHWLQGVSWFFKFCTGNSLPVIQIHSKIFSSAEGGMKQISYKGDIVIGDAKIGMIFRGDKSNNSARGCFERGICCRGFFD